MSNPVATVENLLSAAMLGACGWILAVLLPRARRERDVFGFVCSLLAAFIALFGWLFASPVR